jgi:hypothetical protein
VRNYGVGGYSVYQAYRRLRRVAAGPTPPADYIILNLWEDDHYRNLDAWRRLRFGRHTVCGYTLPHLRVDLQQGTCRECENLLPTPTEVYRLCDPAWVVPAFQDDPVLRLVLAGRQTTGTAAAALEPVAVSFGLPPELVGADAAGEALRQLHTRAALLATRHTLERTEYFCRATGRHLLVVLSFGRRNLAAGIRGEPRFDQPLLDYLATRPYPVVDTRDTFAADFAHSRLDLETYLDRLYVGHHTPYGNYLTAEALLPIVVPWLQPPPRSYPHGWPER